MIKNIKKILTRHIDISWKYEDLREKCIKKIDGQTIYFSLKFDANSNFECLTKLCLSPAGKKKEIYQEDPK